VSVRRDMRRYGWGLKQSIMVNLWWKVEHLPYRGGEGGLCGPLARRGYVRRKAWERR
jgi:hypothetical protein